MATVKQTRNVTSILLNWSEKKIEKRWNKKYIENKKKYCGIYSFYIFGKLFKGDEMQ